MVETDVFDYYFVEPWIKSCCHLFQHTIVNFPMYCVEGKCSV